MKMTGYASCQLCGLGLPLLACDVDIFVVIDKYDSTIKKNKSKRKYVYDGSFLYSNNVVSDVIIWRGN